MLDFIPHPVCSVHSMQSIKFPNTIFLLQNAQNVAKGNDCNWIWHWLYYIVMHTDTHSERMICVSYRIEWFATDSESNDRKYKLKNIYIFKRCLKINAIDFICFNFVQFIQLQQSCIHFTRNHESTFIHCANASRMNAHLLLNSVWNFAVPNRRFFPQI